MKKALFTLAIATLAISTVSYGQAKQYAITNDDINGTNMVGGILITPPAARFQKLTRPRAGRESAAAISRTTVLRFRTRQVPFCFERIVGGGQIPFALVLLIVVWPARLFRSHGTPNQHARKSFRHPARPSGEGFLRPGPS